MAEIVEIGATGFYCTMASHERRRGVARSLRLPPGYILSLLFAGFRIYVPGVYGTACITWCLAENLELLPRW